MSDECVSVYVYVGVGGLRGCSLQCVRLLKQWQMPSFNPTVSVLHSVLNW